VDRLSLRGVQAILSTFSNTGEVLFCFVSAAGYF